MSINSDIMGMKNINVFYFNVQRRTLIKQLKYNVTDMYINVSINEIYC